ncbi:MAG: D-sedoheptulose-7-phosphate isomerase [Sulfobacillus sp.]
MTDHFADLIRDQLQASADLKLQVLGHHLEAIYNGAFMLVESLRAGGKILLCGNGGSAADAQHIAAELVGRFRLERAPLPAISLTTNASSLTAIANDYGYEGVFGRQVAAFGRAGDTLVAISTSGKSPNVIMAAEEARSLGINVVGLMGESAGHLAALCEVAVQVPSSDVARIQEVHITIGHIWCDIVEKSLFE